jgi:predicted nucleic acid-binding protein
MAFPILGTPKPNFPDSAGDPLVGGTITTLNPSDDTVKASYPTADDANASTNGTSGDITLDARGEPTTTQYWGRDGEDYKVVIKDSAGSTIYTLDDIRMPVDNLRATVTFTGADTTPTVAESNMFITAGTTAITDFDDGKVGDIITIAAATSITITYNASIIKLWRQTDFLMRTGDTLTLAMATDQVWTEVGRKIAKGHRLPVTFTGADATPTIAASETFSTNGSTAITQFDDGVLGDTITIRATAAITITDSAFIALKGSVNFDMVSGDTLTLQIFTGEVWHEIARTTTTAGYETVTTTNVITASESGKTFFLNTAAGFTSTLPAPALGLKFKFIVSTAPTSSGGYLVTTNAAAAIIFGTIVDTTATLEGNAETTITFVFDTSLVGDSAEFESDGTNWYMTAQSQANGGISRA